MNVILSISDFSTEHVYFLDKKQNIVFDGVFTKIMYSNHLFVMNGIFFHFPIKILKVSENMNKYYVSFTPLPRCNTGVSENSELLRNFSDMETALLDFYKKMNGCNKKTNNMLSKQLFNGGIKIFNSYHKDIHGFTPLNISDGQKLSSEPACFVVKVSGIWETNDEIGITYKIYNC